MIFKKQSFKCLSGQKKGGACSKQVIVNIFREIT